MTAERDWPKNFLKRGPISERTSDPEAISKSLTEASAWLETIPRPSGVRATAIVSSPLRSVRTTAPVTRSQIAGGPWRCAQTTRRPSDDIAIPLIAPGASSLRSSAPDATTVRRDRDTRGPPRVAGQLPEQGAGLEVPDTDQLVV